MASKEEALRETVYLRAGCGTLGDTQETLTDLPAVPFCVPSCHEKAEELRRSQGDSRVACHANNLTSQPADGIVLFFGSQACHVSFDEIVRRPPVHLREEIAGPKRDLRVARSAARLSQAGLEADRLVNVRVLLKH